MPQPDPTLLPMVLASNLRLIREQRDLTQGQLAKLCDIPRSTLANIEAGSGNPTLAVLARLASALRLSLEELLATPKARCELFPAGTLPMRGTRKDAPVSVKKLLPHPIPGMEIDRVQLAPRATLTGVPHHPGTYEYLSCERGVVELRVGGERYQLSQGDVAAFAADQRHSYHNPGTQPAVGFSVVTLAPLAPSGPNPRF